MVEAEFALNVYMCVKDSHGITVNRSIFLFSRLVFNHSLTGVSLVSGVSGE